MKKLFLIDGNSLANRAFYALPFLTNKKGEPSGAVFGFLNLLIKLIQEEKPDELIVAFDVSRKTFRTEIYQEYKAQRKPMPEELRSQLPVIKEMLKIMNIAVKEQSGVEADDIIGTICKNRDDMQRIVITGDRDLLQIINPSCEVWLTKKGITDLLKVSVENIDEHFGYLPFQVPDMKGLMGDASDNIPGVLGVGEKTALKLIQQFQTLEGVYENIEEISGKLKEKLLADKDNAFLSKNLATIKTDCVVENMKGEYSFPLLKEVYDFCYEWNFSSLLKKKEIFEENVNFSNITERIKIENLDDVRKIKKEINNYLSLNFEKMEISTNKSKVYFVEPVFSMFSQGLDFKDLLIELKSVFEDEKIIKISTSVKSDMHILDKLNIKIENYFDVNVAQYLINGGLKIGEDFETGELALLMKNQKKLLQEMDLESLFYSCELPLVKILFEMEKNGFKIDRNKLKELSGFFNAENERIKKEIFGFSGEEFNVSSPKQVSHILFEKLQLKSYNNKKLSTGIDYLLDMQHQHPIISKIIEYRKINKILTTYITVYEKIIAEKGDVIHTVFNQTLTATGRLSSSDPNLQNIPTRDEMGKELKKIFVSKFENGKILSADYNQIELRLMAHLSGEQEFIKAYNQGKDIHSLTASKIFQIPLEKVTDSQRSSAKAVNFGVIYGISDYGLSQTIKSTKKDAKNFIDTFFESNKKIKEFNNDCVEFAEKNGFVKTMFGRIRKIPEINASNTILKNFAKRTAMNMPLQGSASDIIKFAMIKVFESLKGLKSQLILQIHDELVIDVYEGEEEKVLEIVKKEMENVIKLSINLPVSINLGQSLFECK